MLAVMTLFDVGSAGNIHSLFGSSIHSILIPEAAAATVDSDSDFDGKWQNFKSRHRKSYRDNQEEKNRRQVFKDNLSRIEQLNNENEKINGHRPFGINEYSDLSPDEFAKG